MAARFRFLFSITIIALGMLLPLQDAVAGCTLNKDAGQVMMVERNVMTLEKMLAGNDKQGAVSRMRSKLADLKSRGAAFPGKAAPLEKECEALNKEGKALDAMKKERDKQLAEINAKIKENKAEYDRVIIPKQQALRAELDSIHAMGCPFDGSKLEKEQYEMCAGPESTYNGHASALRGEADRYRAKHDQLVAQKKKVSRPYDERLKKARARYQNFKQGWEGYNNERKRWDSDLKQVWGESTQQIMQAQKSRRKPVQQAAPAKPRGGEIGKLSGPMEKGSSGRSPGSAKLPGSVNAGGEGGAKGQARAAKSTGQQGVGAQSDSEAAFQAGRVFDRGDVKVSGDASVVDARGAEQKEVPEAVRQNPRWQALDRKEQAYRAEQQKVQQKIEVIEKKLQAGEGDKGKLQVELVRARDEQDKIQSKVNVIKVEKESFQLSIEEKPAAPSPDAGKQGKGN